MILSTGPYTLVWGLRSRVFDKGLILKILGTVPYVLGTMLFWYTMAMEDDLMSTDGSFVWISKLRAKGMGLGDENTEFEAGVSKIVLDLLLDAAVQALHLFAHYA